MHGMCISGEKLVTHTPYKHFHGELMNMLAGKRGSPGMSSSDAKRLVRWLKLNNTLPESEILRYIVTTLVPLKGRTPKLQPFHDQSSGHESSNPAPAASNADPQEMFEYGEVAEFSEDHLVFCTTSRLCKDLLPSWKRGQRGILEKAMEKEAGISEPRPDYCFGLEVDMYPDIEDPHINEYTRVLIGVRSNLIHPFLIFEGKAARGSLADAENQAIRGGATLVYARRILNHKAGLLYSTGPDKQSFAFSMTLDCYGARVWVHWCEVQSRKGSAGAEDNTFLANEYYETYHMDSLASCDFSKLEDVQRLMRILTNILDWGCLQRKKEVDCVLEMLMKKEEEEQTRQKEEQTRQIEEQLRQKEEEEQNRQANVGDGSQKRKRPRKDK